MGGSKQPEEVDPHAETVSLGEADTVTASKSDGSAAVPVVVAGVADDVAEAIEVPQELADAIKRLIEKRNSSLLERLIEEGRLEVFSRTDGVFYQAQNITEINFGRDDDESIVVFYLGLRPGGTPDMADWIHKTVSFSLLEKTLRLVEK